MYINIEIHIIIKMYSSYVPVYIYIIHIPILYSDTLWVRYDWVGYD